MRASQKKQLFVAIPLLFALLSGTLFLTTRVEEENLRGLILDINDADAQEILQAAIDQDLTTVSTVEEMTATLDFDEVFSEMTADETLKLLYELDLFNHGALPGNLEQKKTELLRRDVKLDILRPDGVLTALVSASGGSVLKEQKSPPHPENARMVKDVLRQQFDFNPMPVLDVLEPIHLLELFEGRPETSTTDPVDRLFGYLWGTTGINEEIYWDPELPNVGYPDFIVLRNGEVRPSVTEAVNATSQMPAGHRALHPWNLHFDIPVPPNDIQRLPIYDTIQIPNRSGAMVQLMLPWMTNWEQTFTPRIDDFFGEYKAEWIRQFGGDGSDALDSLIFDDETYPSHYYLFVAGMGGPNFNQSEAALNLEPGTLMNVIENDPRWPALRDKMKAYGIYDFGDIYAWHAMNDKRTGIWNTVLQQERTATFNRAYYEQIKKHFPDIRFSNYLDRNQNQIVFYGGIHRFQEPFFGVGAHTGNEQQVSLYDVVGGSVSYPGGRREHMDPPSGFTVAGLSGSGGVLTLQLNESFTGAYLHPGDNVFIYGLCGAGKHPVTNVQVPFDSSLFTGEHTIVEFPQPNVLRIDMDIEKVGSDSFPHILQWSSTCNLLGVRSEHSYQGMQGNLRNFMSAITTSNVPVLPTFSAPKYVNALGEGPLFPHYGETVFHTAVGGASDIEYWNSFGITPEDNVWIDRLTGEASDLMGYANRKTITHVENSWSAPYTITGMDTGGRIVWRMTPNDIKYPTHTIVSMKPAVIELTGDLGTVTFSPPNSEVIIPEEPQSDLGYWIVQSKEAGILTTTAEAALRIITGVPPQMVEMAGEETTEITVEAGETKTLIFAGFDPLNPPVGRNIQTLPIKIQGIAMPEEWKSFAQFVEYPYNIGTAQGEIYVLQLSPDEDDIGNYSATFVTEKGEPLEMTINVSLTEPVPE